MNKTQRKHKLIANQPDCSLCGIKLTIPKNGGQCHNAAIISSDGKSLICYICHKEAQTQSGLQALKFIPRMLKKIDRITGIITCIRRIKISCNQFYYFKIRRGVPTGRKPSWL